MVVSLKVCNSSFFSLYFHCSFILFFPAFELILLLSGKTFLRLSVLVKIDLNLLFLRIIGYYRSFLVKISAFYNAYSLKLKTKPLDE